MRTEAQARDFVPKAMARLRSGEGIRSVDLTFEISGHEVKHLTLVLACVRFLNGLGPDDSDDGPEATAAYELVAEVEGAGAGTEEERNAAARAAGMR